MLLVVNTAANVIVFFATLWVLLSPHIPTRTGGAITLMGMAFGAFGNIVSHGACRSEAEVLFNVAVAAAALWAFWRLELEPRFHPTN